jgi:hypothetical protein
MLTRHAWWVTITCLGLTIGGCSSTALPPGSVVAQATSQGTPQVTVSVDGSGIAAERREEFEQRGGAEALANGVLSELARTGKEPAPGPAELRVVITSFRLRSTGSGFWFGPMAGADKLDVDVTVLQDAQVLKTYSTGVAGVVAGVIKPGAGGRFNGLIEVAAQRIVEEL